MEQMTWEQLMADISKMKEEELKALINYELSTTRRKSFIERMHQRYSKLRAKRERDNLFNGGLL